MNKILCTKYNNNGDYAGFLLLNEGVNLTEKDKAELTGVAIGFYQDTNPTYERIVRTSIGEIHLLGKINQQIERRKVIEGFINHSSAADKEKNTTQSKEAKWQAQIMALTVDWLDYCKISDPNIAKEFESVLKIVLASVNTANNKIDPRIMLPLILKGIIKSNHHNVSNLVLVDYIDSILNSNNKKL